MGDAWFDDDSMTIRWQFDDDSMTIRWWFNDDDDDDDDDDLDDHDDLDDLDDHEHGWLWMMDDGWWMMDADGKQQWWVQAWLVFTNDWQMALHGC